MRLKVICQICGEVGSTETEAIDEYWYSEPANTYCKNKTDWDLWFCERCWNRLENDDDDIADDTWDKLRKLLECPEETNGNNIEKYGKEEIE